MTCSSSQQKHGIRTVTTVYTVPYLCTCTWVTVLWLSVWNFICRLYPCACRPEYAQM